MRIRQASQLRADLIGDWMLQRVAGAIEPLYLPLRGLSRQRIQHGQHRCDADTGAQQHEWSILLDRGDEKAAPWRSHIQSSAIRTSCW
jgi:hypothetical protein